MIIEQKDEKCNGTVKTVTLRLGDDRVVMRPPVFDCFYRRPSGFSTKGDAGIDIGYYAQIRMIVTLEEAIVDSETVNEGIKFPSEVLKTTGSFYIEEGKTPVLTLQTSVLLNMSR